MAEKKAKKKLTKNHATLACIGVVIAGGSVVCSGVEIGGAWGGVGIVLGFVGIIVVCGDILRRTES